MTPQSIVDELARVTLPNVFNPYRDVCVVHDGPDSPGIRRENLRQYLDTVAAYGIDSVWIGRDCGYKGARRTGVALTDEFQLSTLGKHLTVTGLVKATKGNPVKERTATEVWKLICEVNVQTFLWNVFPFHPFEAGDPMSNRRHSAREFKECQELLRCILGWLQPTEIIALGADASNALRLTGFEVTSVRHPSYGGHIEFARSIRKLYTSERSSAGTPDACSLVLQTLL